MDEKIINEDVDIEKLHKKKVGKIISSSIFLALATVATVFATIFFVSLMQTLDSGNAAAAIFGGLFLIVFYIFALAFVLAFAIPALTISISSKGTLSIIYIVISSLELVWAIGSFIYFIAIR